MDDEEQLDELDFHHPYTPYDVQLQFMRVVYSILQTGQGQIGILESPTGTGKSLSLICSALTWLRNHKSSTHEAELEAAAKEFEHEPQWLVDQHLKRKREELSQRWSDREERLQALRHKEEALEQAPRKRRRVDQVSSAPGDDGSEWLLAEQQDDGRNSAQDSLSGLSRESRQVLERFGLGGPQKADLNDDTFYQEIKIYYTSRTHSQLSQFITELRRPTFPPSLPPSFSSSPGETPETVKLLPLSSRQRLCINPSVAWLGSVQAINDRCAELQQAKDGNNCPFMPGQESLAQTHQFRDAVLASLPDIEDLYRLGKSLGVCPYYASRTALPEAEIITLPYPLLLQKSAREALGIKLEGNIVIIDEAHNVMDAVANVHAAELRLSDLERGRDMLRVYAKRFSKKLATQNRVNVGRVARVMDSLASWMEGAKSFKQEQGIVEPNHLVRAKGADQVNLFELIRFLQESKLAYKVESYAANVGKDAESSGTADSGSKSPVLHALTSFLVALTNTSSEGRVFYHQSKQGSALTDVQLSYLLLSPKHAFSSIASSARAVILAGGTMSPFDDYKRHLFPTLEENKLTTLSCGHVIPPENLCVSTLEMTRPGAPVFDFSYQHRGDQAMMMELGLALLNICSAVPDGVVVFFPSYIYLDQVIGAWQQQQQRQQPSIWDRLQSRKTVFRDMKGVSSDNVLQQYADAILIDQKKAQGASGNKMNNGNGALLLSVVGGTMSEGINFSDGLGRCVVVVGLPYPNAASAEWKAKMEYVESATAGSEASRRQASREFYENACMRAVNQSIGRAIRHRGDYAAIVLVDRRYGNKGIRGKLPGWVRAGLTKDGAVAGSNMLGGLMGTLRRFFQSKSR
ncbi:hypothetical protein CDD82_3416 [Ophiocordyceps australis]|uniref:ATP-dependent DNA helicase CHL1 n=1 Tax=Ophiocordyceps australis TaxID=1399860 RepID=A0A2C5ZCP7_9HYPO|nr:hypothetical protein CDD82_3416 [Ophiocordyceps australis]